MDVDSTHPAVPPSSPSAHPSLRIPIYTSLRDSITDGEESSHHSGGTHDSSPPLLDTPPRVLTPPDLTDCTARRPLEDDGDPERWAAPVRKDGMHACDPEQLHWRSDPSDETHGNFKITLRRYLPSFGEHDDDPTRCYHCGGIPCPIDHAAQWETRLKDMDFVRELTEERNALREELKKVDSIIRKHKAKEHQLELKGFVLKEQMKKQQQEKLELERAKILLEGEIERLRNINDHQQQELAELRKANKQIKLIQYRLEAAQKEIDRLQVENNSMAIMVSSQAKEIFQLSKDKRTLSSQLDEAQNKTRQLTVLLDEAKEELAKSLQSSRDKDSEISELKSGLNMLVHELQIQTLVFKDKEIDYKTIIQQLKQSVGELRQRGDDASNRIIILEGQIEEYLREIERLRNLLRSNYGFRHYVNIKRNYNDLQEKHVDLLHKVKEIDPGMPPVLKASGRVVSKSRPQSALYNSTSILQRANSAPPKVCRSRQILKASMDVTINDT